MRSNRVYKVMNRPLTILGAERRLFFVAEERRCRSTRARTTQRQAKSRVEITQQTTAHHAASWWATQREAPDTKPDGEKPDQPGTGATRKDQKADQ